MFGGVHSMQSIHGFRKRSNCLGWKALCKSKDYRSCPEEDDDNVRVRTLLTVGTRFPPTLELSLVESLVSNDSSSRPEDDDVNVRVRTINTVNARFPRMLKLSILESSV